MERDFKGVWIPKHIWLNPELGMLDKVLLVEIDSLDQSERGCYASNKYLADFCQCSESAVSKSVSKLTKLGFITCKNFDGRQRELKSNMNRQVKSNNVPSKIYEADEQNLLQSNIINKTNNKIDNINSPDGQDSKQLNTLDKPNNQLFRTENKPKKKGENKFVSIVQELCSNQLVRDALLKYLNFRRQRGLTADQWELMVSKFKQDSNGKTVQQIVDCITQCTINGRHSLYYTEYDNQTVKNKPVQDFYTQKPEQPSNYKMEFDLCYEPLYENVDSPE